MAEERARACTLPLTVLREVKKQPLSWAIGKLDLQLVQPENHLDFSWRNPAQDCLTLSLFWSTWDAGWAVQIFTNPNRRQYPH